MQASTSRKSCRLSVPAFSSASNLKTPVPEPMSWPRYLLLSIGPPETTTAGRSQLAAPMTREGVVLSQPHNSTTPSMGFARIDSSTSMLTRFRKSIAVGRRFVSPNDITGNSRGRPPASHTPRLTCSAIWRKWARREFRPGVADTDDRPPVKDMIGKTLIAHPASVYETVFVCLPKPCGGAILPLLVGHGRDVDNMLTIVLTYAKQVNTLSLRIAEQTPPPGCTKEMDFCRRMAR